MAAYNLISGGSGAVGIYLVQLATLATLQVTTASRHPEANVAFLRSLGTGEVSSYQELEGKRIAYDLIIDTVGGPRLETAWGLVKGEGILITVDSISFDFEAKHSKALDSGK